MSNHLSVSQKVASLVSTKSQLSLTQQANSLGIARQSLYYQPVAISQGEIDIKNQIDEIYTRWPFYGYRKITDELVKIRKEAINHKRVARYLREMGLQAIYPGPKTSIPNSQHQIFPYLLRNISAAYPNHIWGTDITYLCTW